jgi:DNA invertase Pin-like site-specific DNA recombinase
MFDMLGAFAEFERSLIRERQREGIALAKKKGLYRGRKPSLTAEQASDLRKRVSAGERKAAWRGSLASVGRHCISTYVRRWGGFLFMFKIDQTHICRIRHYMRHETRPYRQTGP